MLFVFAGPKGNLIIKCNCCKQYFATEDDLKKHKKEAHLKVLTCPHCKKVYTTRNNLKKHIKIVHKKQPRKKQRYTCEKCGKFNEFFDIDSSWFCTDIVWICFLYASRFGIRKYSISRGSYKIGLRPKSHLQVRSMWQNSFKCLHVWGTFEDAPRWWQ